MRGPPSRYASVSDSCLWPVYGVIAYREGGGQKCVVPPPPPSRYASGWELSRVGNVRGWKCTGGRRPGGNCPTICTGYPVCLLVL